MNELTVKLILSGCLNKSMSMPEIVSLTGQSRQMIHNVLKTREGGSLMSMALLLEEDSKFRTTQKGKEWLKNKEEELKRSLEEVQIKENRRQEGITEAATRLSEYKKFLQEKYSDEVEMLESTSKPLFIDFSKILEFSPDLFNFFYDHPEDSLQSIALALKEISHEHTDFQIFNFSVRPKPIGDIRHEDYNSLVAIRGIISQRGEPRPQVQKIRYECPSCAANQVIMQTERKIINPKKCYSCGYRGKFTDIGKDLKTVQVLKIEELGEDVGSRSQPTDMYVILENGLCDINKQHLYNCGNIVKITGVVKEREKKEKDSVDFDQIMYAFCVDGESEDLNMTISKEEQDTIKSVSSRKDYVTKIVHSFAPEISECDEMKEALILQAVSSDIGERRGIIHVAFIGDPATGKSSLAKETKKIIPRSRYVSGDSATQVGLTASVEKDELTGGYVLKAGALPLSNNSVCVIDELDKLKEKDALHGALEAGEINVDKAGIHARLRAKTAVLATMNPRFGRFDRNEPFLKQIDISQPLLTRFDLVFIQLDGAGDKDRGVARSILGFEEEKEKLLSTRLLSKYLWKAKQVKARLNDNANKYLEDYYVSQRKNLINPETGFFFNPRHFAGICRIAVAYAKLQFREIATVEDANKAIIIFNKSISSIRAFSETAMQEFEKGANYAEEDLIKRIKEIIASEKTNKNGVLEKLRLTLGGIDEQTVNKVLYKYLNIEWKLDKSIFTEIGKIDVKSI